MQHGPVGVRCVECLYPSSAMPPGMPTRVGLAIGVALGLAVLWVALLLAASFLSEMPTPNLLLSIMAGVLEGYVIWRICGRAWDGRTARWAVGIAMAIPLLVSLIFQVLVYLSSQQLIWLDWKLDLRSLLAIALSGLFAWCVVTAKNWKRDIHL
jgi:uncharacterized PurR-regulated membrane protein YhhQ (DUF165 family)